MSRELLIAVLVLAAVPSARAAQPVVRTERSGDLEQGKATGMVVTGRGTLYAGPRIEPQGSPFPVSDPAQVWAMTGDASGNVFLGTSPEGRVFKISPDGETTLFFTADEPMITALATTDRGELLAATAPGGVVYRISPDGRGEIWSETDELYVWALAPAPGGQIYAGTGQRGKILRIGADGQIDLVFDSEESHIVSLEALPDGGLLAGGAGSGLVYRIDSEGHALVLHDDDLPEVVALASDGESVLAALLAPPEPEARRPVLRLRLPDRAQVGASTETAPDVLEDEAGPTLHGVIEGIPLVSEPEAQQIRGRVVRIQADGETVEIWSSSREAPFCLLPDGHGGAFFGTGEPGRLYQADLQGEVARISSLEESQVTGLLSSSGGILLATANPARVFRLGRSTAGPGEFLSRPIDAGGIARWGQIRWLPIQAAGTEFYTRTGNSRSPDRTWSAWSPALRDGSGSQIVNPDARFLQWRVQQSARRGQAVELSRVTLTYEPYNRAPRLEAFRVDASENWLNGPVTFLWRSDDPDGDPVQVSVDYRGVGQSEWKLAGVSSGTAGEGRLVWETETLPEGEYEIRASASDQLANPRGMGRTMVDRSGLRIVVDRTPPEIELRKVGSAAAEAVVEDRLSILRSVVLIRDGEVRFTARPADGVCDARREVFPLALPDEAHGDWSVRGTDAAGNAMERSLDDVKRAN